MLCPEKSGQFLKYSNLEEAQKLVKDVVNFVKECIKTAEEWLKTDDELDQKPLFVTRFSWKGFEASSANRQMPHPFQMPPVRLRQLA